MEFNGKPFAQKQFKFRRETVTITKKFVGGVWLVTISHVSNSKEDSRLLMENTSTHLDEEKAEEDFQNCVSTFDKACVLHWFTHQHRALIQRVNR